MKRWLRKQFRSRARGAREYKKKWTCRLSFRALSRRKKAGYPKDRSGFTILADGFRSHEGDIPGHRLI
jgi:hypothetical protein